MAARAPGGHPAGAGGRSRLDLRPGAGRPSSTTASRWWLTPHTPWWPSPSGSSSYELAEACRESAWVGHRQDAHPSRRSVDHLDRASPTACPPRPARPVQSCNHGAARQRSMRPPRGGWPRSTPSSPKPSRDYVEANGHRAIRYDVIDPTLAEVPASPPASRCRSARTRVLTRRRRGGGPPATRPLRRRSSAHAGIAPGG